VEAAMAEHRQLLATNAALDTELAGLEDRAEASVVHMAQLRRVLTQLEKHKVHHGHDASCNSPMVHMAQLRRALTPLERRKVHAGSTCNWPPASDYIGNACPTHASCHRR
jgi:hypothetical protein